MTIITNHDGREERDDGAIVTKLKTKLRHGHAAIRGKRSGGGYDSSSSDDNEKLIIVSEEDDSSISTSASLNRSMAGLVDESGDDSNEVKDYHSTTGGRSVAAAATSSIPRIKKTRNKDDKKALLQKMGRPPTILLPLEFIQAKNSKSTSSNSKDNASMKAIEIPNVLLPTNYLRDNPSWKVTSMAKR